MWLFYIDTAELTCLLSVYAAASPIVLQMLWWPVCSNVDLASSVRVYVIGLACP